MLDADLKVSFVLLTVTFHANPAHNLTRPPRTPDADRKGVASGGELVARLLACDARADAHL